MLIASYGLVGHEPVEFFSTVAGPALTPLAERVLDHYRIRVPPTRCKNST